MGKNRDRGPRPQQPQDWRATLGNLAVPKKEEPPQPAVSAQEPPASTPLPAEDQQPPSDSDIDYEVFRRRTDDDEGDDVVLQRREEEDAEPILPRAKASAVEVAPIHAEQAGAAVAISSDPTPQEKPRIPQRDTAAERTQAAEALRQKIEALLNQDTYSANSPEWYAYYAVRLMNTPGEPFCFERTVEPLRERLLDTLSPGEVYWHSRRKLMDGGRRYHPDNLTTTTLCVGGVRYPQSTDDGRITIRLSPYIQEGKEVVEFDPRHPVTQKPYSNDPRRCAFLLSLKLQNDIQNSIEKGAEVLYNARIPNEAKSTPGFKEQYTATYKSIIQQLKKLWEEDAVAEIERRAYDIRTKYDIEPSPSVAVDRGIENDKIFGPRKILHEVNVSAFEGDGGYSGRSRYDSSTYHYFTLGDPISEFTCEALYKDDQRLSRTRGLEFKKNKLWHDILSRTECSPWDVVDWAQQQGKNEIAKMVRDWIIYGGWDDRIMYAVRGRYAEEIAPVVINGHQLSDKIIRLGSATSDIEDALIQGLADRSGDASRFIADIRRQIAASRNESFNRQVIELFGLQHPADSSTQASAARPQSTLDTPKPQPDSTELEPSQKINWDDHPGIGRKGEVDPRLLLSRGDEFLEFRGTTQPGWVTVARFEKRGGGNWAHTVFSLEIPQGVEAWRRTRDKTIIGPNNQRFYYQYADSWRDVPVWCPQEVVRRLSPKTAERLDSAEKG